MSWLSRIRSMVFYLLDYKQWNQPSVFRINTSNFEYAKLLSSVKHLHLITLIFRWTTRNRNKLSTNRIYKNIKHKKKSYCTLKICTWTQKIISTIQMKILFNFRPYTKTWFEIVYTIGLIDYECITKYI